MASWGRSGPVTGLPCLSKGIHSFLVDSIPCTGIAIFYDQVFAPQCGTLLLTRCWPIILDELIERAMQSLYGVVDDRERIYG